MEICKSAFLVLLAICMSMATSSRPNIIIFLVDDLGWDDIGFHGSREIPTPNIDTLAYDGLILSNYYVQPICTPTRSALLTGRHPIHTGLQRDTISGAAPYGLGLNETILPQYLRTLGYRTHLVGKWHLGFYADEYTPTKRGFESHFGYYTGKEDYWDHTNREGGDSVPWGLDFWRDGQVVKDSFGQYSTEVFMNETVNIIRTHNTSQPLFLYLAQQGVHSANKWSPLQAPYDYVSKMAHIKDPNRRTFAGMVSAVDDSFRRLVHALNDKHMLNNTIIVFSTDNGGPANGFDQNWASNMPLRGMKQTLWEGGVRGAGFVWSPLLRQSGRHSHNLMQVIDWVPTLLHAAGYNLKKLPANIDGVNQWAQLNGKNPYKLARTEILHNILSSVDEYALRLGDWKLIFSDRGSTAELDDWYQTPTSSQTLREDRVQNLPQEGNLRMCKDGNEPGCENDGEDNNNTLDRKEILPDSSTLRQQRGNTPVCKNDLEPGCENHVISMEDQEMLPNHDLYRSDLDSVLRGLGRHGRKAGPYVVKCGPKPENRTCNITQAPCLFNIKGDPCEYYNRADEYPDLVQKLYQVMLQYNATAVPPRNKPDDPNGFPSNHWGIWMPWIKLSSN